MRWIAFSVAGLLLAGFANAQQPATRVVAVTPGCPGALTASQQANAEKVTTALEDRNDAAFADRPHGLSVHVEFAGDQAPVKALELRVSYLPLGLRMMPAHAFLLNGLPSGLRVKTYDLDREEGQDVEGNLQVGPAASIALVHLVSVTYVDGTVWRAPSNSACSVTPSRMMEVVQK